MRPISIVAIKVLSKKKEQDLMSQVECNESKHKQVIFQRGLVREETRAVYKGEKM